MKISLEAISYQGSSFHERLTEVVRRLRADATYETESIRGSMFREVVKRFTGMDCDLQITNNPVMRYNAWIVFPPMTKDHIFFKTIGPEEFRDILRADMSYGSLALTLIEKKPHASIDLDKCMVGGLYSQVQTSMCIDISLISNFSFTPEEVAAICLHELGHLFTYFMYIDSNCYGALISLATARDVLGIKDPAKRDYVIKYSADYLGIDYYKAQEVFDSPNENGILYFREYITAQSHNSKYHTYDFRNVEQLADMFCVKHGGGPDQATALYKLYSMGGSLSNSSVASWPLHILLEAIKFILSLLVIWSLAIDFGFFSYLQLVTFLLYTTPGGPKLYDKPEARIKYLRQMLVQDLKNETNKERAADLLRQIDSIKQSESLLKDKRGIAELFWESIPGEYRTQRKHELAAKELEALLYNDLHVSAAKFKQLTTK